MAALSTRFPRSAYFPDQEDGQFAGAGGRYVQNSVSIFGHWLSHAEFMAEPYLFYREATEKGLKRHFLERERRWLNALTEMSVAGVLFDGEKGVHLRRADDPALPGLFRAIVRELPRRQRAYFLGLEAVLWPGFDLTHHFLTKTPEAVDRLKGVAERHGLHLLPA